MTSRRDFLLGGCLAVAAASVPGSASAAGDRAAPRLHCPHEHCRHHRPAEGGGLCALAIHGRPVFGPDALQERLAGEVSR